MNKKVYLGDALVANIFPLYGYETIWVTISYFLWFKAGVNMNLSEI